MEFKLEVLRDYLRAELSGRDTVEETQKFLRAAAATAIKHGCTKAVICVRSSKPIFRVQEYRIYLYLKEIAARPGAKVALVASEREVHSAHQYIELLARQEGASLRAFRDEPKAIEWLKS